MGRKVNIFGIINYTKMKNVFLFLMALCSVASFFACSDDNDGMNPKSLNGIYANASTGNVLDLKYSNSEFFGKTVEFHTADGIKATLKLNGVIPGEMETVLSDVELISDDAGYKFTTKDENDSRTIDFVGGVENGKLVLEVNAKFNNDLIGKWLLNKENSMAMTWMTVDGKSVQLAQIRNVEGKPLGLRLTTKNIVTFALPTLKKLLPKYLKDVTFMEDGNIIATYNASKQGENGAETQDSWKTSNLNQAHYRVKYDVCCVYPNLEMIMHQMETGGTIDVVLLQQLLINGIPCHFELSEGTEATQDALYMYLNEEFFKQLIPFIKLAGTLISEDTLIPVSDSIYISLKEIMTNLPEALEKTESMNVGLNFVVENN